MQKISKSTKESHFGMKGRDYYKKKRLSCHVETAFRLITPTLKDRGYGFLLSEFSIGCIIKTICYNTENSCVYCFTNNYNTICSGCIIQLNLSYG